MRFMKISRLFFVLTFLVAATLQASDFSALEANISRDYATWKASNTGKGALDYAAHLKLNGNHAWAAAVLANGTGVGGLRSTPATAAERDQIFNIIRGLNPTEGFIDRSKTAHSPIGHQHQDLVDILLKADRWKANLLLDQRALPGYTLQREDALATLRDFWGTDTTPAAIRASMNVDRLFADSPLKKNLIGISVSRTSDIGLVSYIPQGYSQITGTATPHLHAYHGTAANHVAIRLDNGGKNKSNTCFIVIEQPLAPEAGDPIRYRGHMWAHEGLSFGGNHNTGITIAIDGPTLLTIDDKQSIRAGVHTHDNALSPDNMRLGGFTFGSKDSIAFSTHAMLADGRVNDTLHIALGDETGIVWKNWDGRSAYAVLDETLKTLPEDSQQYVARFLGYIR